MPIDTHVQEELAGDNQSQEDLIEPAESSVKAPSYSELTQRSEERDPPGPGDDVQMDDFEMRDREDLMPDVGEQDQEPEPTNDDVEPETAPSRSQTDTIAVSKTLLSLVFVDTNFSTIFFQDLKATINSLAVGVQELKNQVEVLTEFQKGPLAEYLKQQAEASAGTQSGPPSVGQPRSSQQRDDRSRSGSATRGHTPPYYNDVEDDLAVYFPINEYTMPMNWLLKKPIVKKFIYYEVIRRAYRTHPLFKPDAEFIIATYMDFLMTPRLQSHFGKSTATGGTMDFARCPMPQVVVEIADTDLLDLGKRRVPGTGTNAEAIKTRCNNVRRMQVLGSDYIKEAESRQEVAHRLLGERVDFYNKHMVTIFLSNMGINGTWRYMNLPFQWLFPSRSAKEMGWTFEVELKKASALSVCSGKPDDKNFNKDKPFHPDLELLMFPTMTIKPPLKTLHEAEILLARLLESRVSVPTYPPDVWSVSAVSNCLCQCIYVNDNHVSFHVKADQGCGYAQP